MLDIISGRLADTKLPPPVADLGDYVGELNLPVEMLPVPLHQLRQAAVLVPLTVRDEGLSVLLTVRTSNLRSHAGQISFPGGGAEECDADAINTALRETEEEVGIARDFVEVAGFLDLYVTVSGYCITPVVGLVRSGYTLRPDPGEVAEVFEVPLEYILDPANHQKRKGFFRDRQLSYYAIPYGDKLIWGATAGMLVNLYEKLK